MPMFENGCLKVQDFPFGNLGNSRVISIKSYVFSRKVASAYGMGEIQLHNIDPWGVIRKSLENQSDNKPLAQYKENKPWFYKMQAEEDGDGEL